MTFAGESHFYTLTFCGALEADFFASYCPDGTTITRTGESTTLAHIHTDQSGIIGLIRHLHNLGCEILEMTIEKEKA